MKLNTPNIQKRCSKPPQMSTKRTKSDCNSNQATVVVKCEATSDNNEDDSSEYIVAPKLDTESEDVTGSREKHALDMNIGCSTVGLGDGTFQDQGKQVLNDHI